jgi:hypothetical protein
MEPYGGQPDIRQPLPDLAHGTKDVAMMMVAFGAKRTLFGTDAEWIGSD